MGRYADSVSQIMLEQGRAQAQAQLGSAQAWGQAAQSLGQIPGQVLAQHRQQAVQDQELKLRQQQIESNEALEAQRRAGTAAAVELTKQDAALRDYFKGLGDGTPDVKAINGIVGPERGIKIAEGFTAMRKLQRDEYTDGATQVHKVMLGFTALSDAQRKDAWEGTRSTLIAKGFMQPADAPEAYDPAWWQQKVAEGVEQAKAPAQTPAQIAALEATTAHTLAQTAAIGKPTPADAATAARFERTQAEVERNNRAQNAIAGQNAATSARTAAASAGDKTELSPEGLDAAAMMFAKTGQLPALGNGDKSTRKAIINRAAALVPGLDVATAKADFGANTASLRGMQTQRDTISAFEQTASKNIDIFLEQAGKVVDTGSPMANTAVRLISGKMLGSPDQAQYEAARQVAVNEIAKITNGGGLSGVLSDSARHEIAEFNPQNATLKQTVAVMRLLKRDMANRASSMDDQIGAITDRISKGAGGADTKKATTMRARDPQGKLHEAPAGTALPTGWTVEP